MNTDHKYRTFADAPGSTHNLVLGLVPPRARVLEFGCATGYMSEVLVSRLGCSVVGIEQTSSAAEVARTRCEKVVVGDAEHLDLCAALGADRFDVILFADVLEHLRDPAALLRRVGPFLAEGGSVVASIPNIAHGSVRLALLRGEFRYRELGLLDNTHIHFFTRESIQDTFEESGYQITQWVRQRLPIDETEIAVPRDEAFSAARDIIARDHEATTYQFVIRAVPLTAALAQVKAVLSEQTRAAEGLAAELAAARQAGEQQRQIIAQREDELSTLKQRSAEHVRALETATASLAEIRHSTAWRVSQRLSEMRLFLAPRNSIRERAFSRLRQIGVQQR